MFYYYYSNTNTLYYTILYHPNLSVLGVPDAPYWVLSTDYRSYALVYSCSDFLGFFYVDFAWILARTRVLTEDIISQLHDQLVAAGVDLNRLTVTNQTGCDVTTQ